MTQSGRTRSKDNDVASRRLGKALLEQRIVYDLIEDDHPIGLIEYSAHRDRVGLSGRGYPIVSERELMTLLEQGLKLRAWRWEDVFAFRDYAGRLIATAEKSALNVFLWSGVAWRFGGSQTIW